jgi:hypothetical protein
MTSRERERETYREIYGERGRKGAREQESEREREGERGCNCFVIACFYTEVFTCITSPSTSRHEEATCDVTTV